MIYDLEKTLFTVSDQIEDTVNDKIYKFEAPWKIRNAFEGVQIFGGIGSGKTSGSGRYLALKYLTNDFGGLVLTVKSDEVKHWKELCALAGRSDDLIIVSPKGDQRFNFIEYESSGNDGKSSTENLVQVLKTVISANEEQNSGKSDDSFWQNSLDLLLFNTIDLVKLAYDEVTLDKLYEIVGSIPKPEDASLTKNVIDEKDSKSDSHKTHTKSAFFIALEKVEEKLRVRKKTWVDNLSEDEYEYLNVSGTLDDQFIWRDETARLFNRVCQFFFDNYIPLSDKTRSIVDFICISFFYKLLREPIYSTFCSGKSTFTPESCLDGKIIILDFPVKLYYSVGRSCQILFKYIWQRAMERRDISVNGRPCFLWADESQNFIHSYDSDYQATTRSCRVSTVYLTQNLANYYANMSSNRAEHRVKAFLGTLNTKIFHSNADIDTNKYASQLIGEWKVTKFNQSEGKSVDGINLNISAEEVYEPRYRPEYFSRLSTGGESNNLFCEAVLHFQGIQLSAEFNSAKMAFNQNFKPTK